MLLGSASSAAEPAIPNFWDAKEQLASPNIDNLGRISFLTTIDFPPFNYIDDSGRLAGFHVDLADAICREIKISDRCRIQALPWNELETALSNGDGEAILAGIAVSPDKRQRFAFGRPYLRFPARFVTLADADIGRSISDFVADRQVGVIDGSAHEAMLRDYFPMARPVTYSRAEWMYADLKSGKIGALFGDGMQFSFWLGSAGSANCCKFSGGPFVSDRYLGHGLSIVTSRENKALNDAFDYALRELSTRGVFAELYLRYFPISFY